MRSLFCVVVGLALIGFTVPALAGDIVAMPTGNSVAPKHVEFNYIYWDLDNPVPSAPDKAQIYEAFIGVMDRVELDVLHVDLEGVDTWTEVNAYFTLVKESAMRPSLIAGCTNIMGDDWIDGKDEESFFALSAYNINVPQGKPSFNDPLVRLHLGWGDDYHEGWFGGLQFRFHPKLGGAILNYQSEPSYMATLIPNKHMELTYGTKNGDPFYRAGLFFNW